MAPTLVISESAWSCSAGSIARFPVTPAPTTGSGSHRGPQSESRIETTAGSWPDRGWHPDQSSTPVPTRYDAASASQFCFPIAIRKCRSLAGAEAHDVVVSVARSQERSSPDGTSPCTRKSSAARASAGDVLAPALRFKSGSARREAGQTQRRLLSRPDSAKRPVSPGVAHGGKRGSRRRPPRPVPPCVQTETVVHHDRFDGGPDVSRGARRISVDYRIVWQSERPGVANSTSWRLVYRSAAAVPLAEEPFGRHRREVGDRRVGRAGCACFLPAVDVQLSSG